METRDIPERQLKVQVGRILALIAEPPYPVVIFVWIAINYFATTVT